jgi:hypothetical protein
MNKKESKIEAINEREKKSPDIEEILLFLFFWLRIIFFKL